VHLSDTSSYFFTEIGQERLPRWGSDLRTFLEIVVIVYQQIEFICLGDTVTVLK